MSMPMPNPTSSRDYAQAHPTGQYPAPVSQRDLSDEQNEKVREVLKRLMSGSNQTDVAARLGADQSTLSKFISGAQGTSVKRAIAIYSLASEPLDDLLGLDLRPLLVADENDPPELVDAIRSRPHWSPATVQTLRSAHGAAKGERRTAQGWASFGDIIESAGKATVQHVAEDPVAEAKAKRPRKRG